MEKFDSSGTLLSWMGMRGTEKAGINPALSVGRSGGTQNSELACGEFIKPHEENGNEKVTCGLKPFSAPINFGQQKRRR